MTGWSVPLDDPALNAVLPLVRKYELVVTDVGPTTIGFSKLGMKRVYPVDRGYLFEKDETILAKVARYCDRDMWTPAA